MPRTVLLSTLLIAALSFPSSGGELRGQAVTTSMITGRVTGEAGEPLAGARIVVTHRATGVSRTTLSREDGRYLMPGLRPGGDYSVRVQSIGFASDEAGGVHLGVGQSERVDFMLSPQAIVLHGIDVLADRAGVISRGRMGATTLVDEPTVRQAPSLSRDVLELIRLSPHVTTSTPGVSAGGRNHRYNNIRIDGAVNNDLFGLAASGTPGGGAGARPITLEAIQELRIQLAPFDVRHGGFTGATIDVITRGGTNDFEASAAYFGRNDGLIGRFEDEQGNRAPAVEDFDQSDLAFSAGGPIVRDRAHFFVAGELTRRTDPFAAVLGVNTGPSPDAVQVVAQEVRRRFGYDVGRSDRFPLATESNNAFARFDVAVSPEHRLTLRHNWVGAFTDRNSAGPGPTFGWSRSGYRINSTTHSSVAQLNSTLGDGLFNELRVGITTARDRRQVGEPFPRMRVELGDGNSVQVGPDEFSGRNAVAQDILEVTNDLTFSRGAHQITLGTSNEFFRFSNLFVRNAFGHWTFDSLEAFQEGEPSRYEYTYLLPGGEDRARFPVRRWSLYGQDRWDVGGRLTLTYGARVDLTRLPRDPRENPVITRSELGRRTDQLPSSGLQLNPRLGFNWDVLGDRTTQLRGGLGLFSGRTPFVWISNAYANSGMDYVRFTCRGDAVPPLTHDPEFQPRACRDGEVGFAPNEVNTVDPDFRFPQVFRASAAVDRALGFAGVTATVEGLYTATRQDIAYRNLLVEPDPSAPDREGRAQWRIRGLEAEEGETPVGEVIDLTNSSQGHAWSVSGQLQRPFANGWGLSAAYTHSDAWDVNQGESSQAVSNWRFNPTPGDPNELPAARSSFLVRHRALLAVTAEVAMSERFPTMLSLVYVGESGHRYSFVYNGDVNGDLQVANDLIHVPAGPEEVRFRESDALSAAESWQNLERFIESRPCLREARGGILARGACEEPWFHQIDLRVAQRFGTVGGQRAEVTLDVLNLANLINPRWGQREFVPSEAYPLLTVADGRDVRSGRVLMEPFPPTERITTTSDLISRYQLQIGVRYSF